MKRSISIINTEIQLINVIEAIHHFDCEDNYLVIGQFNIRPERIQKIEKMMEEPSFKQHFNKIIHLPLYLSNKNPLRFIGYLLAYIKFFFLILFSKKFDCCFLGVVTDIIVKPIVFLTQYKNPQCMLCVIDEGVRVTADANERIKNAELITLQNKKSPKLLYGYYQAITRKWLYPSLTYFSIFQPVLLPQDSLIPNRHVFFKSNKISNIQLSDNAIVIVGQPFYELHITSLDVYQEIICHIVNHHSGKTVYYAPHPIETEYTKWLPQWVCIINSSYPLELILINNHIDTLIGFSSTVLFNYAAMEPQKNTYSISLTKEEYLNPPTQDQITLFNQKLQQFGIHIVDSSFFL